MEDYMLPCLSKMLTGIDCPGCGLQRALWLVCKGEFVAAFKMYPAVYTLLLFGIFVLLHFFDKKRSYTTPIRYLGILNGIIIIVAYFLKFTL